MSLLIASCAGIHYRSGCMSFDAIDRKFRKPEARLQCEACEGFDEVMMEDSRTMYPWDGDADDPNNPNRDIALCSTCAKSHHEYWDDRWAQYRSSQGI